MAITIIKLLGVAGIIYVSVLVTYAIWKARRDNER